ncbi:MAG: hypothetical protein KDB03_22775 [Planctomycetales bacterium]|nr:hypothetical protein [Planctomycetales bacterium]
MANTLIPLFWMIVGAGATQGELRQRVDLIELNHYFDDLGRHSFDQVIFYEWSPDYRRFHVIAWCLVEGDVSRLPRRKAGTNDYVTSWYDRDTMRHRTVIAPLFRETWTQTDPERENRKLIDEKYRVSLLRPNR